MPIVVRNPPRVDQSILDGFVGIGVATVHEAQGRTGLLASYLRPIYRPAHIAGTAVTCEVAPGDNWMISVAIEQCRPGDVLIVKPTSLCEDGYLGDLIATALQVRSVRGVVIDGGVRDAAVLTQMKFPVWCRAISAQGTVKETLGNVNRPISIAGVYVEAGDLIVADDDGVVAVPRLKAAHVLENSRAREIKEAASRERLLAGELGLDMYGYRQRLAAKGLEYVDHPDAQTR